MSPFRFRKVNWNLVPPPTVTTEITVDVLRHTLTLISSSLALVAGLAWNNVIQLLAEELIAKQLGVGGAIVAHLLYAVVITVIVVIMTRLLFRAMTLAPGEKKDVDGTVSGVRGEESSPPAA